MPTGEDSRSHAGQAVYSKPFLSWYGVLVLRFNLSVLWQCPRTHLVQLYEEHLKQQHLDIGVGNGQLLDEGSRWVKDPEVTLMDLNPNSLEHAAGRLRRFSPTLHQADVLAPWQFPHESFESVGMVNLLHCLPGAMPEKAATFRYAREVLTPDGTLFGATILGDGVSPNRLARMGLKRGNRRGHLSNLKDNAGDLERGLAENFRSYELTMQGIIALFSARQPLDPTG